jgi:hypothetical protein
MTTTVVLAIALGIALTGAGLAWRTARRAARQVTALADRYWQLHYEVEELRLQLSRAGLDPGPSRPAVPRPGAADAFVPLTSLKR